MKHMVHKRNKMIKFLKEESALTIIEVLVAVVLTAIVMLHGTVFFIATWRLNAESKDYNLVASDVVANLERCISLARNSTAVTNDEFVTINPTNGTRTRVLRGRYTVTYSLAKTSLVQYEGYIQVISSARWRYNASATSASDTIINIKSAYVPFLSAPNTHNTRWTV
jgi:hypothetical protein